MEAAILLWLAVALGLMGTGMRLLRAYGDEFIEFAKWLRVFLDELRKLR